MQLGPFEWFLCIGVPIGMIIYALFGIFGFIAVMAVGVASMFLVLKFHVTKKLERMGLPHETPNPFLGHLLKINKIGVHGCDMEWSKKYGKIYGSYLGLLPEIVVSDLDILKDVLVKDFNNFTNRRDPADFRAPENKSLFSKMVSILADEKWKNVRSTVTPAFTSGKMKHMVPLVDKCVQTLTKSLAKHAEDKGSLDVKRQFGGLTMDVISACALATELNSIEDPDNPIVKYAKLVFETDLLSPRFLFMLLCPYFSLKILPVFGVNIFSGPSEHFFRGMLTKVIHERRSKPQAKTVDMLQLMLNAHEDTDTDELLPTINDEGPNWETFKKQGLTDEEIIAQSFVFLVAGYDTTATTLTFCLYNLALHQEVQQKCVDEINSVLGDKSDIKYETVHNGLTYLESVVMETLRMYPPLARFDRENRYPCKIGDFEIPAKFGVVIPAYAIMHNEENYPDPEQFIPDRFSPEERAKRNPLLFLPFGYGPRNCIGQRFAIMEIKITLAEVLRKFEFFPCDKTEVQLSQPQMLILFYNYNILDPPDSG